MSAELLAVHDCGLCDGPLTFDGWWHFNSAIPTWTCRDCSWWHTSKDCCEGAAS